MQTYQKVLDKNHEKHLASFEAQGHAAGLKAEPACLIGTRSPLIPAAAVGARPLQTPQGKNMEKPVLNEIRFIAISFDERSHVFLMVFISIQSTPTILFLKYPKPHFLTPH